MGGHQGGDGVMILVGVPIQYDKGSILDKITESYAGTHDMLNKYIWYNEIGNAKNLENTFVGTVGEISNYTNVVLSTPFALSSVLPPEIVNTITAAIKASH
jgi:filamentous hemagglutinin